MWRFRARHQHGEAQFGGFTICLNSIRCLFIYTTKRSGWHRRNTRTVFVHTHPYKEAHFSTEIVSHSVSASPVWAHMHARLDCSGDRFASNLVFGHRWPLFTPPFRPSHKLGAVSLPLSAPPPPSILSVQKHFNAMILWNVKPWPNRNVRAKEIF